MNFSFFPVLWCVLMVLPLTCWETVFWGPHLGFKGSTWLPLHMQSSTEPRMLWGVILHFQLKSLCIAPNWRMDNAKLLFLFYFICVNHSSGSFCHVKGSIDLSYLICRYFQLKLKMSLGFIRYQSLLGLLTSQHYSVFQISLGFPEMNSQLLQQQ